MGEHERANEDMKGHLAGHGIALMDSASPYPLWMAESGHHFAMHRDPQGSWTMSAGHMGDPAGGLVHVALGRGEAEAAAKVPGVFRDREFMGHLSGMYQRAQLNRNPRGYEFDLAREPARRTTDNDVLMDRSR